MFTCPHCGEPGIGFVDKMLNRWIDQAVCRVCKRSSVRSNGVFWTQSIIVLIAMVVLPNIHVSHATRVTWSIIAGAAFLIAGLLGPMDKTLG